VLFVKFHKKPHFQVLAISIESSAKVAYRSFDGRWLAQDICASSYGAGIGLCRPNGCAIGGRARANALAETNPPWQSKVEIIKVYIKIF